MLNIVALWQIIIVTPVPQNSRNLAVVAHPAPAGLPKRVTLPRAHAHEIIEPHQVVLTPGFAHKSRVFLKVLFIEFCDYSMLPVKNYELTLQSSH